MKTLYFFRIKRVRSNINLFWTGNPITGTLVNIVDPDEMPHSAAFHLGLQSLLIQNGYSEIFFFEIITCDLPVYTIDHSDLTASNFMEIFTGFKKLKKSKLRR